MPTYFCWMVQLYVSVVPNMYQCMITSISFSTFAKVELDSFTSIYIINATAMPFSSITVRLRFHHSVLSLWLPRNRPRFHGQVRLRTDRFRLSAMPVIWITGPVSMDCSLTERLSEVSAQCGLQSCLSSSRGAPLAARRKDAGDWS